MLKQFLCRGLDSPRPNHLDNWRGIGPAKDSALLEHLETIGSRVGSKFDTQTDLDQLARDIIVSTSTPAPTCSNFPK